MPDYDDTDAYPAFSGDTAKRDMLRELQLHMEPNVPGAMDLLFRINNSDLSALTDGATNYDPEKTFETS